MDHRVKPWKIAVGVSSKDASRNKGIILSVKFLL